MVPQPRTEAQLALKSGDVFQAKGWVSSNILFVIYVYLMKTIGKREDEEEPSPYEHAGYMCKEVGLCELHRQKKK